MLAPRMMAFFQRRVLMIVAAYVNNEPKGIALKTIEATLEIPEAV
jgi:hypothetical protein